MPRENLMSYASPRDWMRERALLESLCINVGTGNKTWR